MKCAVFTLLAIVAMAHCNHDLDVLMDGNIKFTSKLFSDVAKSNLDRSFVMSAFSVLTPLAQLSLGAEGSTHDELLTAVGLPNDQSTKSAFVELTNRLTSINGSQLNVVSRIYVSKKLSLNKNYADMTQRIFNSDIASADFAHPAETAKKINEWVEDNTNHRVKNLVNPKDLGDETGLLLVNSIYFKSAWQTPFQRVLTQEQDFHVTHNKTVKVQMMSRASIFKSVKSEELGASIVAIPYVDGSSALYIILPNEVDGINQLVEKLNDHSVLETALKKLQPVHIEVQIPRFTIETKINLKSALPHVGVDKIFKRNESELRKIVSGGNHNVFVSEASQKVFVDVNEEGTEAGVANQFITIVSSSIGQKTFVANRPFVFDVRIHNAPVFRGIYTAA